MYKQSNAIQLTMFSTCFLYIQTVKKRRKKPGLVGLPLNKFFFFYSCNHPVVIDDFCIIAHVYPRPLKLLASL